MGFFDTQLDVRRELLKHTLAQSLNVVRSAKAGWEHRRGDDDGRCFV